LQHTAWVNLDLGVAVAVVQQTRTPLAVGKLYVRVGDVSEWPKS